MATEGVGSVLYWFSSRAMTIRVSVDRSGIVVHTAPVAARFIGQHVEALRRWMEKQGGFRMEVL